MHVIVVYIYYFHGYILYHLLCSIFMYCYHVLFMYCVHIQFSYYTFHITFSCMLSSVFHLFLVFFIFQFYDLLHSMYYYIYHFLSCTYIMSLFMYWLHAHAILFISYILFYHIFSYTILYCHILCICVFTLTIELAFTTDSRGNLVLFVIQ